MYVLKPSSKANDFEEGNTEKLFTPGGRLHRSVCHACASLLIVISAVFKAAEKVLHRF